ncbi:DEAD/DEAH box helicase [Pelomonas sp. SE-A7]|uniref:DEAD/DEAH box helicase n=1 Tax=Pelomonas sp. SE-A7 TaxID=3054953 RepID=UPI00259C8FDD|nr:DEAD/DEAH box helicase [Pelomonas sp. SE-A7]MDM4767143.1 DEAD/DEAH box helicase [Pelomonas sp. SE-A7]
MCPPRDDADLPDPPEKEALHQWAGALRRQVSRSQLRELPKLDQAQAGQLLDLLLHEDAPGLAARFRPRLTLRTLGRGDGLLGLSRQGAMGPRGADLTLAWVDWTYGDDAGFAWTTPAPRRLLNSRPAARQQVAGLWLHRDLVAEAQARDQLWESGLLPVAPESLQWRDPAAAEACAPLAWTLVQEALFGEFCATRLPRLQELGWELVLHPGLAHLPVRAGACTARVEKMGGSGRRGSWLLSLGLDIEGEMLDLAPLVADLLRRDARWLRPEAIASMPDEAEVLLHAPGGRRIIAKAAPIKAVVGAMVELLIDIQDAGGVPLTDWEASRLEALDGRAGWQFQGDADLRELAERLRAAGSPAAIAAPAGLGLQLRPYQLEGLAWLQHLRAQGLAGILADDMGLGKTAQTLAHLLVEKQAGRLDRPALAVLPTSLLFNWRAEAARIAPDLRVVTLHGPARHEDHVRLAEADLVLTSYALVWRDIEVLAARPWHLLILDEAQQVKNAGSLAAKALRRLKARHRLCLTGTPIENHLGELWAQFDFLMPGFLGDARSFAKRWRKPIEENGETLRAQLLRQRLRPFILRRLKDQVATELPPLTETVARVALEGTQRELYESVRVAADKQVRRALERQGFDGARIAVLDALLKLRQVCCDPRLLPGGAGGNPGRAKLDWLVETLPRLVEEGRRVLLFSQFTGMLDLVAAELDELGLPWQQLTGATPAGERGRLVERFQAGEVPLFLISLKAGGVGLNLTAADTVVHLDPWWNPAVEEQASARAHRIGQDRPVFVYRLVVEGSIEERMLELQARKKALAGEVLGSDEAGAAKFTAEDLDLLLAPLARL